MTGEKFFTLPDKREAKLFKLRLPDGFGADITNFGGAVCLPGDVVLRRQWKG